jgi:hypothetical protein
MRAEHTFCTTGTSIEFGWSCIATNQTIGFQQNLLIPAESHPPHFHGVQRPDSYPSANRVLVEVRAPAMGKMALGPVSG